MKSQQKKKLFERLEARSKAAAEARENNPNLMAVYTAFLPGAPSRNAPKYVTDKFGNRVLYKTFDFVTGKTRTNG